MICIIVAIICLIDFELFLISYTNEWNFIFSVLNLYLVAKIIQDYMDVELSAKFANCLKNAHVREISYY